MYAIDPLLSQAQAGTDKVYLFMDGLDLVHALPFWSTFLGEEEKKVDRIECVCISERVETSEMFVSGLEALSAA